jgi:predicted MPP superfamily phosphohydrolase
LGGAGFAAPLFALEYWFKKRLSLVSRLIAGMFVLGFLVLADMYWIEPNLPTVDTVTVENSALATKMKGLTVVHISDIHLRHKPGFLEKLLVARINWLQPDLLFITGDFLDDLGSLQDMITLLKSCKVKVGIYGVLGNTDHHFFRTKGLTKELQASGLTLLMNENLRVALPNGHTIWLAGVDDPVGKRDKLTQALDGIPAGEPVLLLAHSPDIYVEAVLAQVSMLCVGHTHGGQVGIPYLIERSDYANRGPFMSGIFHDGTTTMYVNRGIGTKTLPIRFLCRPEITSYVWH